MSKRLMAACVFFLVMALSAASSPAAPAGPHRGFFLSASFQSMWSPVFKGAAGSGDVQIDQSSGGASFAGGYEYNWEKFGVGARLAYFGGRFDGFTASEMPGSPTSVGYADPKMSFIFFDMIVHWFPVANVFGLNGFLGLGSGTESYAISGSSFPEWNGTKSISEFDFSYGLGVRFNPITRLSLLAELRWVPGNAVTAPDSYWVINGVSTLGVTFENHTKILTAGIALNF
jgi:opacity protein-like surface antigen